jgi:RNA polymerase sigma-70 factor (ECF subfamily)
VERSETKQVVGELVDVGESTGRAEAFRRLADRHLDASYRLARAILNDSAEAEDATHDAFVTAWQKWSTLRDPTLFEHWFHRILVNTCRNRLQRSRRWQMQDITADLPSTAADAMSHTWDRDVVGAALARLGPEHRVVVAMRFYRDMKIDEIARQLGIRPGTVKSRLHHALRRLHLMLDEADARETLR